MKNRKKSLLALQESLIEEAKNHTPGSTEHAALVREIMFIEESLNQRKQSWISPDTIITNAVFAGVAVMFMLFERNHAITGKAFTFIRPPKL